MGGNEIVLSSRTYWNPVCDSSSESIPNDGWMSGGQGTKKKQTLQLTQRSTDGKDRSDGL